MKPSCCCNGNAETFEASEGSCCCQGNCKITSIKVLGAGCKSCHEQYENAKTAVKSMGLSVEVEGNHNGCPLLHGRKNYAIQVRITRWADGIFLENRLFFMLYCSGIKYDTHSLE